MMLDMHIEPLPAPADFCAAAGHLFGTVHLSGVWEGEIEVRLAEGLAYEATAAMMMQGLGSVREADALDAIKEIANMIAGAIKSALPRPCAMAVPRSAVASQPFRAGPSTENSIAVGFRHPAGQMLVLVLELEDGLNSRV